MNQTGERSKRSNYTNLLARAILANKKKERRTERGVLPSALHKIGKQMGLINKGNPEEDLNEEKRSLDGNPHGFIPYRIRPRNYSYDQYIINLEEKQRLLRTENEMINRHIANMGKVSNMYPKNRTINQRREINREMNELQKRFNIESKPLTEISGMLNNRIELGRLLLEKVPEFIAEGTRGGNKKRITKSIKKKSTKKKSTTKK